MNLQFQKKNRTLIIQLSGEIDHHTSAEIKRQTENAWSEIGGKNMIFDFTQVTFMDSSGIGLLIGRYKHVDALKGRIAIVCANERITEIIRLSGLQKILPVFTSMENALTYIEGRAGDEL